MLSISASEEVLEIFGSSFPIVEHPVSVFLSVRDQMSRNVGNYQSGLRDIPQERRLQMIPCLEQSDAVCIKCNVYLTRELRDKVGHDRFLLHSFQ
jgi:hypothetical protein